MGAGVGTVRGMTDTTNRDHVIRQMRDAILDNDLAIVKLVNKRLSLVAKLRDYKAEHDMPFLDTEREAWMHRYHRSANSGPLTAEGLSDLLNHLLDLTKTETRARSDA